MIYRQIKDQDRPTRQPAFAESVDDLRQQSSAPLSLSGEDKPDVVNSNAFQIYAAKNSLLLARLRHYLLSEDRYADFELANRDNIVTTLNTNKNTLSKAVKAITGKTLMEYIRFIQIEEVRRLFAEQPDYSIESIANECGFQSMNTFYRQFKKQYGMTPNDYRKIASSEMYIN